MTTRKSKLRPKLKPETNGHDGDWLPIIPNKDFFTNTTDEDYLETITIMNSSGNEMIFSTVSDGHDRPVMALDASETQTIVVNVLPGSCLMANQPGEYFAY